MSSSAKQIDALQRYLDELARTNDSELTQRYALRWPRRPPGLYWQMRWLVALILRCLEYIRVWSPDPWPVVLEQANSRAGARPLLIWAMGTDRDTVRKVCDGVSRLESSLPGVAPVLITDVADFAYFSRLGWLVEYLPRLSGEGEPYEKRKARFLARLYRGAAALPASAILKAGRDPDDLRRRLQARR